MAVKIKATYKSVRLPLVFRAANWIGSAVHAASRRPMVSLSPNSLWTAAERRSGLRREEDATIQQRLERLLRLA